ncbi:hypothetical protein EJ02DRAFT_459230 [Clathrospora elynae]|uniref:Uncharacterized protein n=1 Tax=Clathrospora elynae TaxID=706981 RepID=A0A6A5SHD7_9PLEO|nr:hypothetical protein EJ02DRAFT_459230 [Clathrospora elynae]
MGQGQSQQRAELRSATPEPVVSDEERAQAQAEMRAKQKAALDKRFPNQPTKPRTASPAGAQPTRKPSALQEASKENVGWRNIDMQTEFRRWD